MKKVILLITCFLIFVMSHRAYGHGADADSSQAKVGKNFAVLAYDSHQGFQLSPQAIQRLKIRWSPINPLDKIEIPDSALLWIQKQPIVFRWRRNVFTPIPVSVLKKTKNKIFVESNFLQSSDSIVIQNASILRVIQMDLGLDLREVTSHQEKVLKQNDQVDYGHSHDSDSQDEHHHKEHLEEHHHEGHYHD